MIGNYGTSRVDGCKTGIEESNTSAYSPVHGGNNSGLRRQSALEKALEAQLERL
jgi:hypothetical protein